MNGLELAWRLGEMAEEILRSKPQARLRERRDELVLLLREAEKALLTAQGAEWNQ